MTEYPIGIIGGSGLYHMEGLEIIDKRHVKTPFGEPSGPYVLGTLDGRPVAFLSRHGAGHTIMPSDLNFRANIFGFKLLGARWLIAVSAVGSMKTAYQPTHIVVPDQFYDRTRHRPDTFFGDGLVAHVSMADPVCPTLWRLLGDAAQAEGATVHRGGTYLCMEGPQFSTRAESRIYRQWGVDVIGMTNLQEAKLAREAEIAYATLAMITDYDCWHEEEDDVSVDAVLEVLRQNARTAQQVVRRTAASLDDPSLTSPAFDALKTALITDPQAVPAATLHKLAPIVGRYFGTWED